jgi:hypothetical protein
MQLAHLSSEHEKGGELLMSSNIMDGLDCMAAPLAVPIRAWTMVKERERERERERDKERERMREREREREERERERKRERE